MTRMAGFHFYFTAESDPGPAGVLAEGSVSRCSRRLLLLSRKIRLTENFGRKLEGKMAL